MITNLCTACPRNCKVDRSVALGVCRSGSAIRVARYGLHMWEEPPISGSYGSGTIFFTGCNLGCIYCQNSELSRGGLGVDITPQQLADIMRDLYHQGAHNINLVTPSHYTQGIIAALDIYKPPIPICYNTSSYDSIDTLQSLKGYIDIYLADLKYMDSNIARAYSQAQDYPSVATAAISVMRSQVKDIIGNNGIMTQGLIIRHLVLPNNIANSKACISHIAEYVGKDTYTSIMSQYTPCGSNLPLELNRTLKPIEYKIILNHAEELGLINCYIQGSSSATTDYIPDFHKGIAELREFILHNS